MLIFHHLRQQNLQNVTIRLWVVSVASAISILVGCLVLLGWYGDIEGLKSGYLNTGIMKVSTAVCFVLSGLSLGLFNIAKFTKEKTSYFHRKRLAYLQFSQVCALVVAMIGLLTAVEYLGGSNIIDQVLGNQSLSVAISHWRQMGFSTALNFLLIGSALSLLGKKKIKYRFWYVQILCVMAVLISLQALIGYAYNVKFFYQLLPQSTLMPLHTVVTLLILSAGILWVRPDQGLMRSITSDSYSGIISRRLLLAATLIPFVVGWLIIKGEQAHLYDPAFAISLFVIILIVLFGVVIWQSASVIGRLSQQRDRAQADLRRYQEKLESLVNANIIGILFSSVFGRIEQANEEFLRLIGYTQQDLVAGRVNWRNLTPPEYLHLDEQAIAQAKTSVNGACMPYEKEYIRQDGSRVPVLVGFVLLGEKRQESVAFIVDLSDRRKTENQVLQLNKDLQRRVTELQTLLDVLPVGIGIAEDSKCQTIKVNPAFAKKLQISPEQNASLSAPVPERPTNFKVYYHGRELAPEELPMQYAATHGVEVLDFEVQIVHENGSSVNLLEYVAPLFDEDGQTRGCIGAFLDITERKQAEEVLRNHQKWLEDVLNLMPIPLLFIEPRTAKITFANRAADELAGGKFPQDRSAYYYIDANGNRLPEQKMPEVRVARGERLAGLELDWHTCTGVRSLLIFADTLPAMHSYPATCVMSCQDITKLKQVEKDLSSGYNKLQLLFNTANNLLSSQQPEALIDQVFRKLAAHIDLDVYFNFVVENDSYLRLASYTGITEEMAIQIERLEFGQAVCGTVAQQRKAMVFENLDYCIDPKTEIVRANKIKAYYSYPLIAQGRLLGTLSFGSRRCTSFTENQLALMQAVCDQIAISMERASLITSLKEQAEQLREANRMKDEFLAILSHELRSPLNAILGWAQLLRVRKFKEEQMAKALETIERNARSQTQLIEDLLDISRIIRGKLQLNVRTCDLGSIITAAIETVNLAARAKEIDLQFETLPHTEPNNQPRFLISGDRERLQQIIWNLLANAIKFTPMGGKVEIRLTKTAIPNPEYSYKQLQIESYAQIEVRDTGIGIDSDFLPYVFDRFRQADSSSTRSHGGLGIGLALVRHLVELHGGTVHVDSPGPNQGSTFTVKLPLLVTDQISTPEQPSPQTKEFCSSSFSVSLAGVRVLVVDDEADSRIFVTTVLEQCQAQVQAVASVAEALALLPSWQPDVLVSDIGMPEEDGYSLIRKVRSQPPELGGKIPAAALTAYARAEDRMRAIQEGYQLHLPKPIEPAELATVVASLVGRTQS
ncbi:MAG TPA: ATP-binding protein [Nostocaceae cyanobacterium]|nr:ATP-binding protein [Nostocaceae cyanobacterium]